MTKRRIETGVAVLGDSIYICGFGLVSKYTEFSENKFPLENVMLFENNLKLYALI